MNRLKKGRFNPKPEKPQRKSKTPAMPDVDEDMN
jgi:hypothetical protein